jgi:hypothetical protein
MLSWAINLNPEKAHLCAYFIADKPEREAGR